MKKVLYVGESHFLNTGYAVYAKEVLSRLHATGKYDITELGSYGDPRDKRAFADWRYIGNMPTSHAEAEVFKSDPSNQFGKWRFEDLCLTLKPDIVFSILDVWMFDYLIKSPLKDYYHLTVMPTVDSSPINPEWIMTYQGADAIFSYTDWGMEELKRCSGDLLNLGGVAIPGTNPEDFKQILNKNAHKQKMGLISNANYIGVVMRNQKRKLFDDLFEAFRTLLDSLPEEKSNKTYLYCHTSYPDSGWKFPTLLKQYGLSSKVVFTYLCEGCRTYSPMYFADAKAICPKCNQSSVRMPNVKFGVDSPTLGAIMNCFDCLVQYSIAESPGMPQAECASTGTYIFSVDYSGMHDIIQKLETGAISVERFYRESETHRYFALPSNKDLVEKLREFILLPQTVKARMGYMARLKAKENFDWDKTAKVWENHFDSVVPKNNWNSPPSIFNPVNQFPERCSNYDFVKYCLTKVLGEPEKIYTYFGMKLLQDLNNEYTSEFMGGPHISDHSLLGSQERQKDFKKDQLIQTLMDLRNKKNEWEMKRCGMTKWEIPHWAK